ncbi:MAG: glycosyltransferase family 9 protein [Elusimicrobiota bacterium]|jgi:heptosyltransferase-2|nr:glycosyltransferase family 9 protein [Elusimicrobiota bacterium]
MKKILVITNGNIGDFVMASSALRLLRQGEPSAEISLIASIKIKPFIEKLNFADAVLYTDFSFARTILRQRADQILWFVKNYFRLKSANFDTCIFLDHSRFLAKAIALIGIKSLVGPSTWWCGDNIKNPNIKMLTHIADLPPNSDNFHMSQRYQTIIRIYLKTSNLAMPILPQTDDDLKNETSRILSRKKKFAITISWRGDDIKGNKRIYPVKYLIKIIQELSANFDIDFYLLGIQNSFKGAQEIISACRNLSITNLCGRTKLMHLKPIFEQTDLLISVDTGIIHIAAATNVNIIGLYGPILYNSLPMSHRAQILYVKQPCSPCHYSRTVLKIPCPYGGKPKCLSDITPQMVIEAAEKQLAAGSLKRLPITPKSIANVNCCHLNAEMV